MKKIKLLTVVLLVFVLCFSVFAACKHGHTQNLTDEPLNAEIVADYTKTAQERTETFASGSKGYSWENGDPFNVWWNPADVSYQGGKLSLSVSEMKEKEQAWDETTSSFKDCNAGYYGGEERSEHYYGYGDFQVRMKPAKIHGTASTFFVCTGPYDQWYNEKGEVVKENHHDEIDIEFLGKDTTKVQFNYFANGQGGHEYMYDLGFDASEEFHNYGFRWTKDYIVWFVDEKPVYKVFRNEIAKGEAWPEEAGRLIMNYWCGTLKAAAWMGSFKNDYSGHAEYEWVKCSAEPCPDPISSKPGVTPGPGPDDKPDNPTLTVPTEGWTSIPVEGFDGWGMYTVEKTADSVTISHEVERSGYKCCGTSLQNSYSWMKFNIKNNSTEKAVVRVDIKKEGSSGGVKAVVDSDKVGYLSADSAVLVTLEAGEETEVVAQLKDVTINQIVVFLNGTDVGLATKGSITISALQGILSEGGEEPTPTPTPTPEGWSVIDLSGFDGWGKYSVDKTDGVRISHTTKIETYGCCGADVKPTSNTVKVVVKNNAQTTSFVKISIKYDKSEGSRSAILSATINGEAVGYVEYGALVELAGGAEAEVILVLDLAQNPDKLVVSMNSEGDGTMPTSGDITIVGVWQAKGE